jgi:hypothetical protein
MILADAASNTYDMDESPIVVNSNGSLTCGFSIMSRDAWVFHRNTRPYQGVLKQKHHKGWQTGDLVDI